MQFNCPKCNKTYDNIISLSKHWSKTHKEPTHLLYLSFNNLEKAPTCKCGCGKETKFLDAGRGYSDFIQGHQSRVKNNFVSEKAQQNSAKTRRKMFASGELETWNKGKTKETHPSVAEYGKKGSVSISSNPEEIERRSKRMKENRLNGTIQTLSGKDHSQWRGGVSSLNHTCRANGNLYRKWIKPKMIKAAFSCERCGCRGHLEVHHDKETFSEILRTFADKYNWEENLTSKMEESPKLFELKQKISNEVAQYHIDNNISGIVLCKSCHKDEHDKHNP